jgi:hypothetical protein
MLVSFLAYSSTLKMETTCSSETLVDFQQTTWHYIPENRTLHTEFQLITPQHFNPLHWSSGCAPTQTEVAFVVRMSGYFAGHLPSNPASLRHCLVVEMLSLMP